MKLCVNEKKYRDGLTRCTRDEVSGTVTEGRIGRENVRSLSLLSCRDF